MAEGGGLTLLKSKSGTRMVSADGKGSEFEFPEPQWQDDAKTTACTKCSATFGLLVRKHHCRFCGKIFCGKCCTAELPSTRQGFVDPVRLCQSCTPIVKKDNDFMAKQLPILTAGACFVVSGASDDPLLCKLEKPTHRNIVFGPRHEPVGLRSIVRVEDITSGSGTAVNGITLHCRVSEGEKSVALLLDGVTDHKKSLQWLGALKKALQALHGPSPKNPHKKGA